MQRAFSRRSRWWLAVVQVAMLLATFVMPAAAATDPASLTGPQLVQLLQTYGIVKGDPSGNLNLDKPITRAEMMTIMVRALGAEAEAQLYKGLVTYSDIKGHWAEGYIAYATIKGLVQGDGDGTVRPNDPISYAESLTLIVRLVDKEPTGGDWPINIMLAAADMDIVPPGVNVGNMRESAVRGAIFQSLSQTITTVKLPDGKSFLQTHVAKTAPLLSLATPVASTKDATVQLTGTVQGAHSLTVNGTAVIFSGTSFSTSVALEYGDNTITVVAADMAGNKSSAEAKVSRIHPIASIEMDGPAKVRPGGTATYTITAKDGSGSAAALTGVTATVEGNVGTFNLVSKTFTASTTPAKGKIVLTAGTFTKSFDVEVMGKADNANRLSIRTVNSGRAVSFTQPMTVQVEVQDNLGQFIGEDYGRPVSLTASGLAGLTVSPLIAHTEAGVATFTVRTSTMGGVGLQASTEGIAGAAATANFGSNLRVRLSADQSALQIGGSSTLSRVRATLVNENGSTVVNNTSSDIIVQIATNNSSVGIITDNTLRINRGVSNSAASGDEGMFSVGAVAGTATITGTTLSGEALTVDSTTITVSTPTIGTGTFWDMLGSTTRTPNSVSDLVVRLSSSTGATIQGSYAFQLKVETSNNEPKVNGIPTGVSITLGNTFNPVSDGIAEGAANDGDDVVVRTSAGVISFKVNYDKPGQVFITVIPMAATSTAYATDGSVGTAASSQGIPERTFTLNYTGTAYGLRLLADSNLGQNLSVGAHRNNTTGTFTLHALLIDEAGNWVPNGTGTVTLNRGFGSSTTPPTQLSATAQNGKATFVVNATTLIGEDTYTVSATLPTSSGNPTPTVKTSNTVNLQVQSAVPLAPSILATRGISNGIPGSLNYLAPSDTGLEIELARDTAQQWVVARVYREGHSSPIHTSIPVNLSDPAPRVVVPKSVLTTGVHRYQVSLVNGFGESPRSLSTSNITNSVFVTNLSLSNAKYNRTTKTLVLNGAGFGTASDLVNPALVTINDVSTSQSISLAGAQVTVNGYSQITFNLTGLGIVTALENPALFSGNDVKITTAASWYTRATGEQSAAITTGALVGPLAHIRHLVYDRVNSRLLLKGDGFTTGTVNFSKLVLKATGATDIVLNSFSNSRVDDTTWSINLHASAVQALDANGAYALTAQDSWFYDSGWTQGELTGIPIYGQVSLASVTYNRTTHALTLNGNGFSGGSVTISGVHITDLSTGESVTLSGTAAPDSDTSILFTLDQPAYDVLEDLAKFQGTDIYLTANAGWFTNSLGRPAAEIPTRTMRLPEQQ